MSRKGPTDHLRVLPRRRDHLADRLRSNGAPSLRERSYLAAECSALSWALDALEGGSDDNA